VKGDSRFPLKPLKIIIFTAPDWQHSMSLFKRAGIKIRKVLTGDKSLPSLPPPNEKEAALISDLRKGMEALRSEKTTATDFWTRKRLELFENVKNKDPRAFTRWEVMYPMFFSPDPLELDYLKSSSSWKLYEDVLEEDRIGCPTPFHEFPSSSGNLIHHLYTLHRFIEESRTDLSSMHSIFEFGGGYGSFCRLCYKMGFRGSYYIFDLPEYSLMQSYFLKSLDLGLQVFVNDLGGDKGRVNLVSDINLLPSVPAPDLWVGMWSLSETPVAFRNEVFERMRPSASWLIGFQEDFLGINNREFFESWVQKRPGVKFSFLPISHMKWNHYLFGKS
jgi:hypothetical protein